MGKDITQKLVEFSPSSVANYLTCPQKFKLSKEHRIQLDSTAVRDGNLFEGYVLGFESEGEKSQKILEGRKKAESLDFLKNQASYLKDVFTEGESQKYIEYSNGIWNLRGIQDWIGNINIEKLSELCGYELPFYLQNGIFDLKYTNNVQKIWNGKDEPEELLQSICYPYIMYKITGEILPFCYIIVDSQFQKPIVRVMYVEATENDFRFIESLLNDLSNDCFYLPNVGENTCGGEKHSQSRCPYAEFCEYGRAYIGGFTSKIFQQ